MREEEERKKETLFINRNHPHYNKNQQPPPSTQQNLHGSSFIFISPSSRPLHKTHTAILLQSPHTHRHTIVCNLTLILSTPSKSSRQPSTFTVNHHHLPHSRLSSSINHRHHRLSSIISFLYFFLLLVI